MAIIGSVKKIFNSATTEVIDSQLTAKLSDLLTTVVSTSFKVVDETLLTIQDLTKENTSTDGGDDDA